MTPNSRWYDESLAEVQNSVRSSLGTPSKRGITMNNIPPSCTIIGNASEDTILRLFDSRSPLFIAGSFFHHVTSEKLSVIVAALEERKDLLVQEGLDNKQQDFVVAPFFEEDFRKFRTTEWKAFFEAFPNPPSLRIVDRGLSESTLRQLVALSQCQSLQYEYKGRSGPEFQSKIDVLLSFNSTVDFTCVFCNRKDDDLYHLLEYIDQHPSVKALTVGITVSMLSVRRIFGIFADFISTNTSLKGLSLNLYNTCGSVICVSDILDSTIVRAFRHNYTLKEVSISNNTREWSTRDAVSSDVCSTMEKIYDTVQANRKGRTSGTDVVQLSRKLSRDPTEKVLHESWTEYPDSVLMELIVPLVNHISCK